MKHCLRWVVLCGLLVIPATLFSQRPPRADLSLILARHEIRGSRVEYRPGAQIEALRTWRLGGATTWSPVAAGGAGGVWGRMGECEIQPDGRCAPSGSFVHLSALIGADRMSGRRFGRLALGPALYSGSGDTSFGVESRLMFSVPVDELVAVGLTIKATRLPSHRGESLTLLAYGVTLTF